MSVNNYMSRIEAKNREILNYRRMITQDQEKTIRLRSDIKRDKENAKNRLKYAKDLPSKSKIRDQRDRSVNKSNSDIERLKLDIEAKRGKISSCREEIKRYREEISKIKKRK